MSISPPIPQIRIFQTLTLKLQVQGHGCGQRARPYSQLGPLSYWYAFFLFHINQITISEIQLFWYLTLKKIKGQGHGWGQRSKSHNSPSIQPMQLLFVSHQLDQPFLRYVQKSVWPWKKHIRNFTRKFAKMTSSIKIPPKSNQVITMTSEI